MGVQMVIYDYWLYMTIFHVSRWGFKRSSVTQCGLTAATKFECQNSKFETNPKFQGFNSQNRNALRL